MVLSVGNVQELSVQGHTLWMMERGRRKISIGFANSTAASHCQHVTLQVSDDNTVIVGVSDVESLRRRIGEHFAGEGQGPTSVLIFFQREVQRSVVERALAFGFSDQLINSALQNGPIALAG